MACFTTEYGACTNNALAVDSCRIGQDIWVVIRLAGYRFSMHKWNIDTTKWTTIEYKYAHVIEYGTGNVKDFVICSSNGILYMWMGHPDRSRILAFDTNILKWSTWKHASITLPSHSAILVLNNDIFLKLGNQKVFAHPWEVGRAAEHTFSDDDEQPVETKWCEMDGVMYLVKILQNGSRCVLKYDNVIEDFVHLQKECDAPRSYLEHSGSGEEYQTFTYGYNNQIYQGIKLKDRLILDCFDIETKKYYTIFESKITGYDIISISGNDKKAYMVYRMKGVLAVRVIDMKPTLETLSLISVANYCIVNPNNFESSWNILPYGMRPKFGNMTNWKMLEYLLHETHALLNLAKEIKILLLRNR